MGAFNNLIIESLGADREWDGFVDLSDERGVELDENQLTLQLNDSKSGGLPMQPSERFQRLIDSVRNTPDVELAKKRHICSALEYFKSQMLCDSDRRDSTEKIKQAWLGFRVLTRGSELLNISRKI